MHKLTKRQLLMVMRWWQKKLRLEDWNIQLEMTTAAEINAVANCCMSAHLSEATIKMSWPKSRTDADQEDCDLEMDLVHELLHVQFYQASRYCDDRGIDKAQYAMAFERPFNVLARSLVDLRLAERSHFSWEKK